MTTTDSVTRLGRYGRTDGSLLKPVGDAARLNLQAAVRVRRQGSRAWATPHGRRTASCAAPNT